MPKTFFEEFVKAIENFADQKAISKEILQDYSIAKHVLHGVLESSFVEAGWSVDMLPIIEPRISLLEPFDPYRYNQNFRGRFRRHYRPDVGYYSKSILTIFAECCTTDGAMDYIPSNQTTQYTKKGWITKRDTLLHFIQHSSPNVSELIICVTLPNQMKKKPPWPQFRSAGENFFKQFKHGWDTLVKDLQQYTSTHLVIIGEQCIHIDNTCHSVNIT